VNALSKGLSTLLKVLLKFMTTEIANLLTARVVRQQKRPSDDKSVDGRGGCVNRNDLQTAKSVDGSLDRYHRKVRVILLLCRKNVAEH